LFAGMFFCAHAPSMNIPLKKIKYSPFFFM